MSVSGTSGFDIYLGRGACKKYHSTAIPLLNLKKVNYGQTFGFDAPVSEVDYNFESFLFSGKPFTDTVEVTINLPLFDGVKSETERNVLLDAIIMYSSSDYYNASECYGSISQDE